MYYASRSMTLYWDPWWYIGIHVLIYDHIYIHWDPYHFPWDPCHRIGIHDSASIHERDAMSPHMPHGPLKFILPYQLDVSFTLMHYLSLLGPHMGVINALEELVTNYGGGYRLLFGPCDDVACFIFIYLRSTHLEEATHAIYLDFFTWMAHTCER